jgi:hypothetical protein
VETLIAASAICATGFFRIRNNADCEDVKSLFFRRLSQHPPCGATALAVKYLQRFYNKVVRMQQRFNTRAVIGSERLETESRLIARNKAIAPGVIWTRSKFMLENGELN